MRPLNYSRADSVDSATASAAKGGVFIAGGTNLLDLMKLEVMAPKQLVDINRLELSSISDTENGGLRIGALVTNSDCTAHPKIRRDYGVLARAILAGASGQLRNKATTGGNLCQRTRCYYFYDPAMPCNKRAPGSGCQARSGFNRIHEIMGASDERIATYPGDMAVAMCALDATIEIESPGGERKSVPIAQFHRLPGDTPHCRGFSFPVSCVASYISAKRLALRATCLATCASKTWILSRRFRASGIFTRSRRSRYRSITWLCRSVISPMISPISSP